MALIFNTPCGRARPAAQRSLPSSAPAGGGLHRLRAALIPLGIALYCVAIPGLVIVGSDGAGGTAFVVVAALGAGLSLVGIAGRHRPTRISRW